MSKVSVKPDVKDLFSAGAHFGHKTSRRHPSMANYIFGDREGVNIIDLEKTVEKLDDALNLIYEAVASGKEILYVGTKFQVQEAVQKAAQEAEMPFVVNRWLGGMLTNQQTMNKQVKRLKQLKGDMDSGLLASRYSKLEVQRYNEEIERLTSYFGGVEDMSGNPAVVLVTDAVKDSLAVSEASKLNIPIVAISDTNADIRNITHPVPANDDAVKVTELILSYVNLAVKEGKAKAGQKREKPADKEAKPVAKKDEDKKE